MAPWRILQWNGAKVWAGAEVRLVECCRYLSARGHTVITVARGGAPLAQHLRDAGAEVHGIAPHGAADLPRILQVARLARARRVQVIHAHAGRDYVPAILAARLAGCPLVLHRHLYLPLKPSAARMVARFADAVIAVSTPGYETLLHQDRVPKAKVHRVPMVIDPARAECSPDEVERVRRELCAEGRPLIVSVGHLHASKGHDTLIRAVATLAETRPVRLAIVGEGPERPCLEALVRETGLEGSILLGQREDVPALLAACDCFALLSWEDPFPGAVLEAMAAGKPVVGCLAGGVPEMVKHGETGLLVAPHAAAEAADALARILGDASLRRQMGEAGRARFQADFSITRMLEQWETIYRSLVAPR